MLEEKIEGFSEIDSDIQRIQDISNNKVKVKKLSSRETHLQRVLEAEDNLS